jgi:hypothetical protein
MGKQVTVKQGFSAVPLPTQTNPNKPFNGGQTAILTDAEYAALPASVTRALGSPTTVAEPARNSTDPNAKTLNDVTGATGTVALKSGPNRLSMTGNVTVTFPTTGVTPGTRNELEVVCIQDATGSRTLTLPAAAKKAGGTAVTLTTAANSVDYLKFETFDGGVTWILTDKQLDIK